MVSQTLLNLLALALLGIAMFSSVDLLNGHHGALVAAAFAPLGVVLAVLLAPVLIPRAAVLALGAPAGADGRPASFALASARRPARVSPPAPGGGRDRRAAGGVGSAVVELLARC